MSKLTERRTKAAKKALKKYKENPVPQGAKDAALAFYRTVVPLKGEGGEQKTGDRVVDRLVAAKNLEPRVQSLANNEDFTRLISGQSKQTVKRLMSIAAVESKLKPSAVSSGSGDTGLFQQHKATFSKAVARKANKLLKSKGIKGHTIRNLDSLKDPVSALAYQLTVGVPKGSIVEAYKKHQQYKGKGYERIKNVQEADDPMKLQYSKEGLKREGHAALVGTGSTTLRGARTVSDIDDLLKALMDNVEGSTEEKNSRRQVLSSIRDKVRKAYPSAKQRMNTSAGEMSGGLFKDVKRGVEIWDEDTREAVGAARRVPKRAILAKLGLMKKGEKEKFPPMPKKKKKSVKKETPPKLKAKRIGKKSVEKTESDTRSLYERAKDAFREATRGGSPPSKKEMRETVRKTRERQQRLIDEEKRKAAEARARKNRPIVAPRM